MYGNALIYYEKAFLMFSDYNSNRIYKLDTVTTQWSSFGTLANSRKWANVIFDGEVFLIVGGYGTIGTDKCTPTDSKLVCESISPKLLNYQAYPELFLVDTDFGKNKNVS